MDWLLWLCMIPLAWFMWWVGFVATRRMRIEKNKEREIRFKRIAEKKAQEEQGLQQVQDVENL